jgi:hypothetical protein
LIDAKNSEAPDKDGVAESRFDVYAFKGFDAIERPVFELLKADLSLDEVCLSVEGARTRPEVIERISQDGWRGGAFLTPELLVIATGDSPRV